MSSLSTTCSTCGYVFAKQERRVPCPNCGGTTRTFYKRLEGHLELHGALRARQRRPGFPGWFVTLVDRVKRSWHGILARETLIIDRSDPHKTVKTHHVQVRQPDGSWKTVHDETEEFEAKKRPK